MAQYSAELDDVFLALADPTRRAVLGRLGEGRASVGELARLFPMTLPSFMKHVRTLEQSGLIRTERSVGYGSARSTVTAWPSSTAGWPSSGPAGSPAPTASNGS